MGNYRSRMIGELDELNLRVGRLESFTGSDEWEALSEFDQELLASQLKLMTVYRKVLSLRISRAFGNT